MYIYIYIQIYIYMICSCGNMKYVSLSAFAWKSALLTFATMRRSSRLDGAARNTNHFRASNGGVGTNSPSCLLCALYRTAFRDLYVGFISSPLFTSTHPVLIGNLRVGSQHSGTRTATYKFMPLMNITSCILAAYAFFGSSAAVPTSPNALRKSGISSSSADLHSYVSSQMLFGEPH